MRNVLITGAKSYVGENVEKVLNEKGIKTYTLDMIGDGWKDFDFSPYDTVFHVAGIAHDIKGDKLADEYIKVNAELTYECAKKAKESGVSQFVFMSSILVFNNVKTKVISKDTVPSTKGVYAYSKLLAEQKLESLKEENFTVSIMRPPMIFGYNCKGNFKRLVGFANKTKVFPNYKNERSMCYIENFANAVCMVIEEKRGGVFYPQNKEYFCTTDIVRQSAKIFGKKIRFTKLLNLAVKMAMVMGSVKKAFGDYTIDKELSKEFDCVITIDNEESVKRSVTEKI